MSKLIYKIIIKVFLIINKKPGQASAVESVSVFKGQSQLIPFAFRLPKHVLHAVVKQVLQWIFINEQALSLVSNVFIKIKC